MVWLVGWFLSQLSQLGCLCAHAGVPDGVVGWLSWLNLLGCLRAHAGVSDGVVGWLSWLSRLGGCVPMQVCQMAELRMRLDTFVLHHSQAQAQAQGAPWGVGQWQGDLGQASDGECDPMLQAFVAGLQQLLDMQTAALQVCCSRGRGLGVLGLVAGQADGSSTGRLLKG